MLESISPSAIIGIILGYFVILIIISYFTGKDAGNENFFLGGRKSPWYVVAFGMIGTSLSGVTLISVPGWVGGAWKEGVWLEELGSQFSYLVMVFGYLFGYLFIAFVLMPMYYKLKLTSIYTYLDKRFGRVSYKTGASFFLLSRSIGAAFRLYLVAIVLQKFVVEALNAQLDMNIPFPITVLITILLIWVYTFRGGIRTIIWTDTLQTLAMLVAVVLTIVFIGQKMEMSLGEMTTAISQSNYAQVFFWDNFATDGRHVIKLFISGVFIAIVMTGLDQDMMQKNLSCRNLKDAQKNMITFSIVLVFVNLLFLAMGALLYMYASNVGIDIPTKTDLLYPTIALHYLPAAAGVLFVIGLVAAAYSSADSALTSLTTSFCVDILGFERKEDTDSKALRRTRTLVHIGFSVLLFLLIILFWYINDEAVIKQIFTIAGYTYGPLLGLYFFGFFTKQTVLDRWVWLVCVLSPVLSFFLKWLFDNYLGYSMSFELLPLNGLLTFIGLFFISYYDNFKADDILDEELYDV